MAGCVLCMEGFLLLFRMNVAVRSDIIKTSLGYLLEVSRMNIINHQSPGSIAYQELSNQYIGGGQCTILWLQKKTHTVAAKINVTCIQNE